MRLIEKRKEDNGIPAYGGPAGLGAREEDR